MKKALVEAENQQNIIDPNHGYGPRLLTVDEARAYCGGSSRSTWNNWHQSGVVPAPIRVGGRIYWDRHDLDLWIDHLCPGRVKISEIKSSKKERTS